MRWMLAMTSSKRGGSRQDAGVLVSGPVTDPISLRASGPNPQDQI
jgi:hypothetical protein